MLQVSSTGIALAAARVASASGRPLSSAGGWMPLARLRSSAERVLGALVSRVDQLAAARVGVAA